MKRWIGMLLILALLLTCSGQVCALAEEPPAATEEPDAAPETEMSVERARELLGPWLEQDCSFGTHFLCLEEPELCWMEERIDQNCGADDSFSFVISLRRWDRETEQELEEGHWYYYAWENDKYVCTMKHGDSPVESSALSRRDQEDLHRSRGQFIGVESLLPACAEDFRREEAEEEPELLCLRCTLPLEWILQEHPLLAQRLLYVLEQKGLEEYPEGLRVELAFSVEKESFRPRCLRYDFSELIPGLFPEAEAAEDGPVLEMEYRFDFELAETAPMPEVLRPEASWEGIMLDSPLAGKLEDGFYLPTGLDIRIPLEGWTVVDRQSMCEILYGDRAAATLPPETLMAMHIAYGDLMLQHGDTRVVFTLEKTPITFSDGTVVRTAAESAEASADSLPQIYFRAGIPVVSMERDQAELGGRSFEILRLHLKKNLDFYNSLLITERDGVLFTVNITCYGVDETEQIMESILPQA